MHRFADRRAAGRALGERLRATTAPGADLLVLGLPRGGVVVAAEVAATLGAQLDVLVVRKLGLPQQPELAMGAIAAVGEDVETVRVASVIAAAQVDEQAFGRIREREVAELRRREAAYRGNRPAAALSGRDVVLVDDGLATGATLHAAVAAARRQAPRRIVVAVPIGSSRACAVLARIVDELVCLRSPASFRSVGQGYADFGQTSDDEVRAALS
ncbi:MAG: Phosphoribosyltransferase [Blastococcus sp.]|nr:Phosphoribosyltransferase [Blastococcus sp.]